MKYLTLAGREGKHYQEALELMNQARDAIEASKESQEASNGPKPPAQEANRAPVADQLGASRTQEPQEDIRALGTVVSPAEEQPSPEIETAPVSQDQLQTATQAADCTKWEKQRFWKTATYADVAVCLDSGADVNERGDLKNRSLHWAAKYSSDPHIVKALVAAGASVDVRNTYDSTPLHQAAGFNKNPEIIRALLDAGASVDARNKRDRTPLHWAALGNENPEIIQALVAAGASVDARNELDRTPLHFAASRNENTEVIKALVGAGASVLARDEWGDTVLHDAAEWNKNPEVIQVLVDAGANPNARNKKGKKPLDLARKRNRNMLAAAGGTRKQRSGGSGSGLGALIAGVAVGTALGASSASEEEALAAGTVFAEGVRGGGSPGSSTAGGPGAASPGNLGSGTGAGRCEIPGYPSPPGGGANVGLTWCPASVDFQMRAFALQAAGIQCSLAAVPDPPPEVVSQARSQIREVCSRLAALGPGLGVSNCRCPAGYGP